MKDVSNYAVTADGEEELSGAVNRVKAWMDEQPETAKFTISIRVKVKDVAEQREISRTGDMFKNGEPGADGVHRKGRGRKADLRAVEKP